MSLPESAGREGAQGGAGSENSNHQSRDKLGARLLPEDFFQYIGPADTEGNSLYRCLHCASKPLSCNDKSRQNLKKHIAINLIIL